jgi:hypothetical protein
MVFVKILGYLDTYSMARESVENLARRWFGVIRTYTIHTLSLLLTIKVLSYVVVSY